ncbi:MAG: FAD-dependent oxidoreductase, partial [Treponema sp.]|nr:FAD-dependent oxidoreductase [Treponema sp.]
MKLKKFLSIFLGILVLFVSCEKKEPLLRDGTFIGKSDGRNGPIEVAVTIKNGKIVDAEVIKDFESPNIADIAKQTIISQFLEEGSTATLDAVSGATITSNALFDAIDEALAISQGTKKAAIIYKDSEYDIVIIGAGGAGLTAATEASSKGAKVLVLEKMGIIGGNTNYSTGGINASYTKEQQRLGIKDSKEVFFNDTMKGGQYLNDPELVKTLVENSADMVEWLQSPMIGADLSDVGAFGGATNKRIHRPKGGQAIGAHLVPLLQKAALNQGAEIRLNNKAIDILSDNGKVCGVKVAYEGGEYTVHTKAVIVATGGFG